MRWLLIPTLTLASFGGSCACAVPPNDPSGVNDNAVAIDLSRLIHTLGYDGLDPSIRERDVARVAAALQEHANFDRWPTREVARAVDIEGFPERVGRVEQHRESVPVYLIVDPRAIDEAWQHAHTGADARVNYPPLDGVHAQSIVAFFDPCIVQSGTTSLPWPSWADEAAQGSRHPRFDGMDERRWGSAFTNGLGWNNFIRARLDRQGIKPRMVTYVARVSESAWRVMPVREASNPIPRGTLAFPLWESTGLLRPDDDTPRTTPLSATVLARPPDVAIPEAPGFVLVAPFYFYKPMEEDVPLREFVVLPETLATLPVPVAAFSLTPGSRPLAEDYILDIGIPLNKESLVAVCVFATTTDDQLAALAKALTE